MRSMARFIVQTRSVNREGAPLVAKESAKSKGGTVDVHVCARAHAPDAHLVRVSIRGRRSEGWWAGLFFAAGFERSRFAVFW